MKSRKIIVVHGPNLNLLGEREPEIYGRLTLPKMNTKIRAHAKKCGAQVRIFQSNSEGALIDFIHRNRKWADGIVINPAAYTHYSYAIQDAIASVALPAVEVHLSDVNHREAFRKKSVIAPVCLRKISGLGWKSYTKGIDFLCSEKARPSHRLEFE